jgi:hypothetical protein
MNMNISHDLTVWGDETITAWSHPKYRYLGVAGGLVVLGIIFNLLLLLPAIALSTVWIKSSHGHITNNNTALNTYKKFRSLSNSTSYGELAEESLLHYYTERRAVIKEGFGSTDVMETLNNKWERIAVSMHSEAQKNYMVGVVSHADLVKQLIESRQEVRMLEAG